MALLRLSGVLSLLAPALTAHSPADLAQIWMSRAIAVIPVGGRPAARPKATTVSADLLRHPLPEKARRKLQQALKHMNSGDHNAAIRELRETLARYPAAAPYVHSLLGFEYMITDQFASAVECF